ncbi:hypothetical protein [Haloferula sp.]|uniref:hypothetical protein n=1 Tax=Haloferula sp. TaxID=2497595 RepID=UPI003C7662DE
MAKLIYRRAEPEDSEALCDLLRRTPMGSRIRVTQERVGDFFTSAAVQSEEPEVRAAFERATGNAVGLFSAGASRVFLNGSLQRVRYLSDLRIDEAYRKGTLLARGYRLLRDEVFSDGEWARTLILEDNGEAAQILTDGRAGLPEYHPCGTYLSWFLARQRVSGSATGISTRWAEAGDQALMRSFFQEVGPDAEFTRWDDFHPVEGVRRLLAFRDGGLVGLLGVRDTSSFRRTRITSYNHTIRVARPFYNSWAKLHGLPRLPPAGGFLSPKALGPVLCHERDPAILRTMLAEVLSESGLHAIGLDAADPLVAALEGLKAWKTRAGHYLVGFSGEPPELKRPFSFDFAHL